MTKTSASQFELMVDYMERNGDLSKPTEGPNGRLRNIQHWTELNDILHADATGDTKTCDKWRKVWSDLKNNTKRKAARIHRAASGTGGGPAIKLKLSELEERILNIIGTQTATGFVEVVEIGLHQVKGNVSVSEDIETATPPPEASLHRNTQPSSSTQCPTLVECCEPANLSVPLLEASQPDTVSVTPRRRRQLNFTEASPPPSHPLGESLRVSPRRRRRLSVPPSTPTHPTAESVRVTPRRRRRRRSPILNRARRPTQSEISRQVFLNCVSEWRTFLRDRETEHARLREIELQQQARWQDLFQQFLLTLNQAMDIFKNKIQ